MRDSEFKGEKSASLKICFVNHCLCSVKGKHATHSYPVLIRVLIGLSYKKKALLWSLAAGLRAEFVISYSSQKQFNHQNGSSLPFRGTIVLWETEDFGAEKFFFGWGGGCISLIGMAFYDENRSTDYR